MGRACYILVLVLREPVQLFIACEGRVIFSCWYKRAIATFDTMGRTCYLLVLVFREPMQILIGWEGVLCSRVGT